MWDCFTDQTGLRGQEAFVSSRTRCSRWNGWTFNTLWTATAHVRHPLLHRDQRTSRDIYVRSFGNEETCMYYKSLSNYSKLGCYIGLTGYLWKDKSENGVRKILQDNVIPLDRLLVETDSPFMYPNTRASKLPQHVKEAMTERSTMFLQRYCTFQRNEPCSLPVTVKI